MIQFNGNKIKDIMYNGAYIQTVMQNGNILYQRTKPLADGAYIQTVNGDTFTETEYKDIFSSIKSVTKNGITLYALSDFNTNILSSFGSDYDTAVYIQVSFSTAADRNKYTIVEVMIPKSTNEVHAIRFVKNISDSGTSAIKFYYNEVTSGFTSRFTIIPKDKLANGFLFKKGDHKVLCASTKTVATSWGYYGYMSDIPGLSLEEAKQDFNGVQNTETMVSHSNYSENGAAKLCKNYQFPSGKYGYLPACGELNIMANYITEYRSLYNLVNGTSTGGMSIWSSTQVKNNYSLVYVLKVAKANEGIDTNSKGSTYAAVPFQVIE